MPDEPTRVILVGVEMPFVATVRLLLKLGVAAIPVAVILGLVGFVLSAALAGLVAALARAF